MKPLKIILALLFLLTISPICFGQITEKKQAIDAVKYFDENKRWYNDFTEHWFYFNEIPEGDIRDLIIHWEQIGTDLKNASNDWSGTYGNGGETHGDYLRWSERSGFIWLKVNKCQGGPMQIIRGRVSVSSSDIQFIPENTFGEMGSHGSHSKHNRTQSFLLVKWREVPFLIHKESIKDFADYTAGLNSETSGFYGEGGYFTKIHANYVGTANELPIFPVGYEKFVKKPFKATITSIGKSFRREKKKEFDGEGKLIEENYDDWVTEVRLDIGKSSNIYPEVFLRFIPENDDYTIDGITITKVFANYSIGEYVTNIPKKNCKKDEYEDCRAEDSTPLKAGLKLSTTGEW